MFKKGNKPVSEWVIIVNDKIVARGSSFKEVYNISKVRYKHRKVIYCNIINTLFALI